MTRRRMTGLSYQKRVADIQAIYEQYARIGLSNREIWRRHIYPIWAISERTFYNILSTEKKESFTEGMIPPRLPLFPEDDEVETGFRWRRPR